MDNHALTQTKDVQVRPRSPWFNTSILDAKRTRRKPEKTCLSEKSEINTQLLQSARSTVNKLCATAKIIIKQRSKKVLGTKKLYQYKVTDKLLGKNKTRQLPELLTNVDKEMRPGFIMTSHDNEDDIVCKETRASTLRPQGNIILSEFGHCTDDVKKNLFVTLLLILLLFNMVSL